MAAASSSINKESSKSNILSDYDPELDFFSDKFDPLKALNTPGLKPPVANAGLYDNLSKYESEVMKNITVARKKEKVATATEPEFERKFLAHQCKYIIIFCQSI